MEDGELDAILAAWQDRHKSVPVDFGMLKLQRIWQRGNAVCFAGDSDVPEYVAYCWRWLMGVDSFYDSSVRYIAASRFEAEYLPTIPDVALAVCVAGGFYGVAI